MISGRAARGGTRGLAVAAGLIAALCLLPHAGVLLAALGRIGRDGGAARAHGAAGIRGHDRAARGARGGGQLRDRDGLRLARHGLRVPRAAMARARPGDPARLSGLRAGLRLYRPARPSGDRAERAAPGDGMGPARLLVPRGALGGRRGGDADAGALPLRLPPRPLGLHPPGAGAVPGGALARARAALGVPDRLAAHGAPGHRGRRAARGDGDDRRLRHGRLLRRADLRHGHLHELVHPRRPGGGGAARAGAAYLRARAGGARAGHAGARALRGPRGAAHAHPPARRARLVGGRGLRRAGAARGGHPRARARVDGARPPSRIS